MKTRSFKIESIRDIQRITALISSNIEHAPLEIIVRKYQKDRSALQNSYYWKILTILADDYGMLKDEVHEMYKRRYLVRIFERDDPGYSEMIDAIRRVNTEGFQQQAKVMGKQIVKLTSTTAASVSQMREYINDIIKHATSQGIGLPHPDDLGRE